MATLVVGLTTEIYNKNSEPDCYQRGHGVKYSDFKLATSTSVLSILEFIFIATSHKHCAFTITYVFLGTLACLLDDDEA